MALYTASCFVLVARSLAGLVFRRFQTRVHCRGPKPSSDAAGLKVDHPACTCLSLSAHPSNMRQEDTVQSQPYNSFSTLLPSLFIPDQHLSSSGNGVLGRNAKIILPLRVYNSVVLSILTGLGSQQHSLISEHFHHPQKKP